MFSPPATPRGWNSRRTEQYHTSMKSHNDEPGSNQSDSVALGAALGLATGVSAQNQVVMNDNVY